MFGGWFSCWTMLNAWWLQLFEDGFFARVLLLAPAQPGSRSSSRSTLEGGERSSLRSSLWMALSSKSAYTTTSYFLFSVIPSWSSRRICFLQVKLQSLSSFLNLGCSTSGSASRDGKPVFHGDFSVDRSCCLGLEPFGIEGRRGPVDPLQRNTGVTL